MRMSIIGSSGLNMVNYPNIAWNHCYTRLSAKK